MTTRIAINGFGRIGRLVARAWAEAEHSGLDLVAINDPAEAGLSAHLMNWDSVHGPLRDPHTGAPGCQSTEDALILKGRRIAYSQFMDPASLPWAEHKIDIVLECSGALTSRRSAAHHLTAGASKVLISAPADDADRTVVMGVNHTTLTRDDRIVSNASCTTNALAPVAHIIDATFGIDAGFMTTVHAFTGDQSVHDRGHRDWARARAASLSMIPTSTGAARSIGLVLPQLAGRLDGTAIRVPVPNVSMIDLVVTTQQKVNKDALTDAFVLAAASGPLAGILACSDAPLVSCDFNHHPASSIIDLGQIFVVGTTMCRIMAWYDNEWGFSNRMLDVAKHWAGLS